MKLASRIGQGMLALSVKDGHRSTVPFLPFNSLRPAGPGSFGRNPGAARLGTFVDQATVEGGLLTASSHLVGIGKHTVLEQTGSEVKM